jgi:hypothetical protein
VPAVAWLVNEYLALLLRHLFVKASIHSGVDRTTSDEYLFRGNPSPLRMCAEALEQISQQIAIAACVICQRYAACVCWAWP